MPPNHFGYFSHETNTRRTGIITMRAVLNQFAKQWDSENRVSRIQLFPIKRVNFGSISPIFPATSVTTMTWAPCQCEVWQRVACLRFGAFLSHRAIPKSSILDWIVHSKHSILGYHHDYGKLLGPLEIGSSFLTPLRSQAAWTSIGSNEKYLSWLAMELEFPDLKGLQRNGLNMLK